ncbi:NYN domain-containing protein [Leucobacter chromiireducens]|uniref:NYN domain-containing protein n=1 Tax=Leucobacter chromiireducens subsp. chromiireducens TaxID=660067 RepID=A0ABS1SMD5_9MICO|nr:NYN domain-containing protein [Leucobacter chromiireducens]MBL3689243.1 NYN domain-containing protein [Leucobacter chromiireducens subsp. chromiireducens]
MADTQNGRVAVYLDFDNIVLSWYDRVHGRNSFARDRQKITEDPTAPDVTERLQAAAVNVGAIIDYASSFGTLVLTRAYADWSAFVNAEYRSQLVARAVDLVQLFPAAAYAKNGADIRLAVDAVEDMFRLDDLTHVVIVAGDSDYVPLAQRVRRLGRYVVGIGVAGSTAKSLKAACDEFASYDDLPGVEAPKREPAPATRGRRGRGASGGAQSDGAVSGKADAATESAVAGDAAADTASAGADAGSARGAEPAARSGSSSRGRGRRGSGRSADRDDTASSTGATDADEPATTPGAAENDTPDDSVETELSGLINALDALEDEHDADHDDDGDDPDLDATGLLIRALWLSQDKDDSGWLYSSAVKQQMRRMDPSFSERALGFRSFSDFLKSRSDIAELEESGHERLVRLKDQSH